MKKLQLIRPWKLSAVRQHLSDNEVTSGNMDGMFFRPCYGPAATEEVQAARYDADNARTSMTNMHMLFANCAPFSTASFLSTNNTSIR